MAENKYVIFKLGEERYGLPIESVERILPKQAVTRLPRTPKMLLGIFELRGSTIPTVDARLRFDLEESKESHNFVVVLTPEGRCALQVDKVDGIVSLEEDAIEENSTVFHGKGEDFMHGIGKSGENLILLLKPDEIVPKAMRGKVAAAA